MLKRFLVVLFLVVFTFSCMSCTYPSSGNSDNSGFPSSEDSEFLSDSNDTSYESESSEEQLKESESYNYGETESESDNERESNSESIKESESESFDDSQQPVTPPIETDKQEAYSFYPEISETMPAVYINTEDGSNSWATQYSAWDKKNIEYVDATVSVGNCEEKYVFSNAKAEVKVRGNATLNYVKKPIRIKFAKKEKQNMFGLNGGKEYRNWVLLADWKDFSMSNNFLAFYLGNTILGSDGYYCTDFINVEVYLNGQYWGVYLLVEQQEIAEGRTSASELEDDYTGTDIGYLFENDAYYTDEINDPNGDPTFTIDYGDGVGRVSGYTVKSDINDNSQLTFLQNYMNNLYRIAYEATANGKFYKFNDDKNGIIEDTSATSVEEVVSSIIDVQSLVDTYLLNEIVCNLDVDWSSFYMSLDLSKNGSGKLTFEAPWDFDSSFGLRFDLDKYVDGKLWAATRGNPWFRLVVEQEWFIEKVINKWNEIKAYGVLDNALKIIEELKTVNADEYKRNLSRWPERQNDIGEVKPELNAYTEQWQAADYLKRWLTARIEFLDEEWKVFSQNTKYKIEAESAAIGGGIGNSAIRTNRDYASGGCYVGDLSGGGRTLTFTVNAEKSCTAYLYVGISRREMNAIFSEWFPSVTVNGEKLDIPEIIVTQTENYEEPWHTFFTLKLVSVELKEGTNTITFTSGDICTNFDYILLYSNVLLTY